MLVEWFASQAGERPVVVVSPDAGGVRRAEDFRARLETRIGRPVDAAFAGKLRSGGIVTTKPVVGEVAGRCAVIVDDLIGTATTSARTAEDCRTLGAQSVSTASTDRVLSGQAEGARNATILSLSVIARPTGIRASFMPLAASRARPAWHSPARRVPPAPEKSPPASA
ncbi:MAG: phosphoribosyltransferase family protein [Burkholderia multivorans]|nr:phosphoribosyltransferase family protein [Burkholderia multivorans]MDI3302130.1 phosphoribosyltransferase family protein [Burkholderia multivorans]